MDNIQASLYTAAVYRKPAFYYIAVAILFLHTRRYVKQADYAPQSYFLSLLDNL